MVFITAEIGINHNGDINIAKKLIDEALIDNPLEAGANFLNGLSTLYLLLVN